MRVVNVNQQILLVRHWFRWYRVGRGAQDWRPLEVKPYVKEKTIKEIADGLKNRVEQGSSTEE